MKNRQDLNDQLFDAIRDGNYIRVKAAVEAGANIDAHRGLSSVFEYAGASTNRKAFAIVKYLIEQGRKNDDEGERKNAKAFDVRAALRGAVKNTNPDAFVMVRYLVEQSPIWSLEQSYLNVLNSHILISAGGSKTPNALAIIEYLMKQSPSWFWGDDVNVTDGAIEKAAGSLHKDAFAIVKCLVEESWLDGRKCPPASLHTSTMPVSSPATIPAPTVRVSSTTTDRAWEQANVRINNVQAVKNAAGSQHPDAFAIVKYLIEHGTDIHDTDGVLERAVGSPNPDAFAIVRYLIKHRAIINESVIRAAIESKNSDACKILDYVIKHEPGVIDVECNVWGKAPFLVAALLNGKSPYTFAMVKCFVENGVDVNAKDVESGSTALLYAVRMEGHEAFEMVRYLTRCNAEHHGSICDVHVRNRRKHTALTMALYMGKTDIADYLLSRDEFLPSDLIPRPRDLPADKYKTYRKKATMHVVEVIEHNGLFYARAIANDIKKILEAEHPKPTKEDAEALKPIIRKLMSMEQRDWMNEAQVASGEFLGLDMTR